VYGDGIAICVISKHVVWVTYTLQGVSIERLHFLGLLHGVVRLILQNNA